MNNETKFTPGPWESDGDDASWGLFAAEGPVIEANYLGSIEVHNIFDMPLIAAAPDMYRELSDLAADYQCDCGHPRCRIEETRRSIDALLARARGES